MNSSTSSRLHRAWYFVMLVGSVLTALAALSIVLKLVVALPPVPLLTTPLLLCLRASYSSAWPPNIWAAQA